MKNMREMLEAMMQSDKVLEAAEKNGIAISKLWGVKEQMIAVAITGLLDNVPAEAVVTFDVDVWKVAMSVTTIVNMETSIKVSDADKHFRFLVDVSGQKAVDVAHMMREICAMYFDRINRR